MTRPQTPLLDTVSSPAELKRFSDQELRQLADELRTETISAVSETGGHLGAGLGVIELTVALHHVFDAPRDKIIWDVSHQCYPHKILTGRRDRIRTIRQEGASAALPSALKAPMTRSAPPTALPRSPPPSALPRRATLAAQVIPAMAMPSR